MREASRCHRRRPIQYPILILILVLDLLGAGACNGDGGLLGGGLGDPTATLAQRQAISPELPVDAPSLAPSRFASRPAVAFDGANFMVVWADWRSDSDRAVVATRVSPSGAVLDKPNIAVNKGRAAPPAVAFGGSSYLVVWEDDDLHDVYARRVGVDGKPIGSAAMRLWPSDFSDELEPAVAFDGTNFVVVFRSRSGSYNRLVAVRVSQAGVVLDTPPKIVVDPGTPASGDDLVSTRLAFDGANYQLVWQQTTGGNQVQSRKLTPGLGIFVTSDRTVSSGPAARPALAFGSSESLVVWSETSAPSDPLPAIRGARLDPAGNVSAPITIAAAAAGQVAPAVAWEGAGWLVTWAAGTGPNTKLLGARVDAAGALVDPTPFEVCPTLGTKGAPAVGCGGGGCYTAWPDGRKSDNSLYGNLVTAGRVIITEGVLLSVTYNGERDVAAASNGKDYLLVWSDSREGGQKIYGSLFDARGLAKGAGSFSLGLGRPEAQSYPTVASDGNRYLVAWYESGTNHLAVHLYDPFARTPPVQSFPFDAYRPAAAFAGGTYLLLWTDNDPAVTSQYDIFGARFDKDGQLLDTTPLRVTNTPGNDWDVRMATDGTNFFAVWHDFTSVYGARVSQSGAVLDSPPLVLRPADVTRQKSPTIGFDGTNFLVVWTDDSKQLRGTRVGRDGVMLDGATALKLTTSSSTYDDKPALAWDGSRYLLGFQRDTFLSQSTSFVTSVNLWAIDPDGTRHDSAGETCTGCSSAVMNPSLAAGNGHALMAFTRTDSSAGFAFNRARMLVYTETPALGTPCRSTSECLAPAVCVDGVCCDTACGNGASDCQACSYAAGASNNGTCGPVMPGLACNAGLGSAGVCSAAGACIAVPPDAGSDADARDDLGRADAVADRPPELAVDRAPPADAPPDQPAPPADAGSGNDTADPLSPDGTDAPGAADVSPAKPAADGAPDAPGGGGPPAPGSSGCGCQTAGGGAGSLELAALFAGALLLWRRAGRRRRPGMRAWIAAVALACAAAASSGCSKSGTAPDAGPGATPTNDAAADRAAGTPPEGDATDPAADAAADTAAADTPAAETAADVPAADVPADVPAVDRPPSDGAPIDRGADATPAPDTGPRDTGPIDAGDPGPKPAGALCSADGHWCWMNPQPQGQTLTAAWGSGANDLWVMGISSTALHWNGSAWTFTTVPAVYGISAIAGLGASDVWAVGGDGLILHWQGTFWSSPGRVAWSDSFFATTQLTGVWPLGKNDVWFTSGFGIGHYDGTKIAPVSENIGTSKGAFYDVWGASPGDVWFVGSLGSSTSRLGHWDGTTLALSNGPGAGTLYSVRGASATDIWAVGAAGTALHYDGQAWTNHPVPGAVNLRRVWVGASNDVWAIGDGGAAFHWDGQAWSASSTGETNTLLALWGSGAGDLWAFGSYGATVHFNGATWDRRWRGQITSWNTVWGSAVDDVWIAGPAASLHWDGTMLRDAALGAPVSAIHGTARDDVWAVGSNGTLLHYDGNAWTPSPGCGAGVSLRNVRARSRTDAWAAGISVLCHWNGTAWAPMPSGVARILDIAPVGDDDLYIIDDRRILRLAAGILNTVQQDDRTYNHSIFAVAPDDIWVNGYDNGAVYKHWNGVAWGTFTATSGNSDYLYASGPNDVWSVGQYAGLAQRTTGAFSARMAPLLSSADLHGVWSNGQGTVWAVGNEGVIWRRWP